MDDVDRGNQHVENEKHGQVDDTMYQRIGGVEEDQHNGMSMDTSDVVNKIIHKGRGV